VKDVFVEHRFARYEQFLSGSSGVDQVKRLRGELQCLREPSTVTIGDIHYMTCQVLPFDQECKVMLCMGLVPERLVEGSLLGQPSILQKW
jgi:hypothetical protein